MDERGMDDVRIKIIFGGIRFVLGQGMDLAFYILLGHLDQEVGNEAVAAAQNIKPQHSRATEGAQSFFCHGVVVLVDVRARVDEDDIRSVGAFKFVHVFQNFLAGVVETEGFKLAQEYVLL